MISQQFASCQRVPADDEPCPCGSLESYAECCGPLLAGHPVPTALACMRSRYTAHALHHPEHLLRTWHPETRPTGRSNEALEWIGLEIIDVQGGEPDDETGEVEFIAHWRDADGECHELRERSSFCRRAGRWVYVDAV